MPTCLAYVGIRQSRMSCGNLSQGVGTRAIQGPLLRLLRAPAVAACYGTWHSDDDAA
jgi:hypothetical protein